jgi:hypothetical protein
MNKPCNIQNTNICNGIFHISFLKALLINEGERESGRNDSPGERDSGRNDPASRTYRGYITFFTFPTIYCGQDFSMPICAQNLVKNMTCSRLVVISRNPRNMMVTAAVSAQRMYSCIYM